MVEKIGVIRNPLTIIAIFAGIAEVSGTIVLPFVHQDNQYIFIWFLIGFPSVLVVTFFATLNFNNKVLYAPSDYKDETNYIKIFRYDQSRQERVEVKVTKDESANLLLDEFNRMKESLDRRLVHLEDRIVGVENSGNSTSLNARIDYPNLHHVSPIVGVQKFIRKMRKLGFSFEVYGDDFPVEKSGFDRLKDTKAIWLGSKVPLADAKTIIKEARKSYPHLTYVYISGDMSDVPSEEIDSQVYVGGWTNTAEKSFKLTPMSAEQFEELYSAESKERLFEIIRRNYPDDFDQSA
jgi:hypothetical protein